VSNPTAKPAMASQRRIRQLYRRPGSREAA
jgi:hypothetical protein